MIGVYFAKDNHSEQNITIPESICKDNVHFASLMPARHFIADPP
jgi:hypothetical protein